MTAYTTPYKQFSLPLNAITPNILVDTLSQMFSRISSLEHIESQLSARKAISEKPEPVFNRMPAEIVEKIMRYALIC